jgi:hypothetical protein
LQSCPAALHDTKSLSRLLKNGEVGAGAGAASWAVLTTAEDLIMAHFADKAHFDKHTLARLNTVIMLSLIGSGLAACAIGAVIYDFGRLFSVW